MSVVADLRSIGTDAARSAGVTLLLAPQWDDPSCRAGGSYAPDSGFLVHHTAGVGAGVVDWLRGKTYQYKPIPAIQFCVRRDGTIVLIFADKCYHAGAGGPEALAGKYIPKDAGNSYFVGVEIESRGTKRVVSENDDRGITPAQVNSVGHLAAAWCRRYGRPITAVQNHKDWAPTRKIDTLWPASFWRAEVSKRLAVGPQTPAAAPPAPDFTLSLSLFQKLMREGGHHASLLPVKRTLERVLDLPKYDLGKGAKVNAKFRAAWAKYESSLGLKGNAIPQWQSVNALAEENPKIKVVN